MPAQFKRWFFPATAAHNVNTREQVRKHNKQLHDYVGLEQTALLRRSPLGLTRVYNKLDSKTVASTNVKGFQKELLKEVQVKAAAGTHNWAKCLSMPPKLV